MSSYHSSFSYLGKNSSGEGFIIASFEPDNGFVDSYLGMDQITTDSYDGTKKYFYGSKYNTSAQIDITLIKVDGAEFTMEDNRRALRWLTGSRQASWLDFYVDDRLVYSFYGSITACQQYKLDARVIGIKATFSSIHPWAWSAPQSFDCSVGEKLIGFDDCIVYKTYEGDDTRFGITDSGVVYNSSENEGFSFSISDDGVVYNDNSVNLEIDNLSDDLYTLTNLDIVYLNEHINDVFLTIKNLSLDNEESAIKGIKSNEVVTLSAGQFITSETFQSRIFGDDFNFVWPHLRPGINKLFIDGSGKGQVQFSYRYPIKIGDGAFDVDKLGRNPMFEGDISGAAGSSNGLTILGRKNIMLVDKVTNKPYIAFVKDGYLYVAESETRRNKSITLIETQTGSPQEIIVSNGSLYLVEQHQSSDTPARDVIVLVDEVTSIPYKITATGDSLYLSEI